MNDEEVKKAAAPELANVVVDYFRARLEEHRDEYKARHQNHVLNNALVNEMQREVSAMSYRLPDPGYYRSGAAQPIIIYPPTPNMTMTAPAQQAPAPAPAAQDPGIVGKLDELKSAVGGAVGSGKSTLLKVLGTGLASALLGAGGVGVGSWIQAANAKPPAVNVAAPQVHINPADLDINLLGPNGNVIPDRVKVVPK